ncbi:hypothetical protein [Candidatus Ruminimicrobium bovinum]|uniref:hypothetical protein n=1 Tax=Candidatus Ruminimicrobium bovinum TaxID=3242779 RepID=UPI0039B84749
MVLTKTFYQIITWFLVGFMLLTNLVNLTTNQQVNSCVSNAYSATSISEYYTSVVDGSIKLITNFVVKITNGHINVNTANAAVPSKQNKNESKSDVALAILAASDYKNINTFYDTSAGYALVSNFVFDKVVFLTSSVLNFFGIISLFLICLFGLARSDTEDNNIKNNNIVKFRLV